MKTFGNILKVLAAVAAVAGLIVVIIKYGDKIVSWTRETFSKYLPCCCQDNSEVVAEAAEEAAPVADEDFEAVE